jgi:hypothetical protein
MILRALRYKKLMGDYRKEWYGELEKILNNTDDDAETVIRELISERHFLAVSGMYVPIFLEIIACDEPANKSDHMMSAINLAMGIIDDETENYDHKRKLKEMDWFEDILKGHHTTADNLDPKKKAIITLVDYTLNQIDEPYLDSFQKDVIECKYATIIDDEQTIPDLSIRAEVGKTCGKVYFDLVQSRIEQNISDYEPVFVQLCTGSAILDDMTDVYDDYGIKVTKPLELIDGKPTLRRIISKGIIPKTLADSKPEFNKGLEACTSDKMQKAYSQTANLLKMFYTINLFRRYMKHSLNLNV